MPDAPSFVVTMNLRVTDIARFYELWRSRSATFIDPDGYLIEVGQPTFTASPLDLYT